MTSHSSSGAQCQTQSGPDVSGWTGRPPVRPQRCLLVTEQQLTEAIVANADLWASCIGGAAQRDSYHHAIEAAGLGIQMVRQNRYEFISEQARTASAKYGVNSISVLAVKPG